MTGTVKRWDDRKGFGFIEDAKGRELFVHYSYILGEGFKSLSPGDQVTFDLYEGKGGLEAREVRKT